MAHYLLFGTWCLLISTTYSALYANLWAVHVKGGERMARSVADETGFTYIDKIMEDYYHFRHHQVHKRSIEENIHHHSKLLLHSKVLWVAQQEIKSRKKRDALQFSDEKYNRQWYLHGPKESGRSSATDMNIQVAWKKGFTGRGIVVTVLDDGIEKVHPDLLSNYDAEASYDINDHDGDPTPRYDFTNENRHGTRCAGEVAASANNSICGIGVAYDVGIGGIRMLDGDVTDSVEAASLSYNRDHIDIYSASWGPDDDGKTVDGPASLARRAFREGVTRGRGGKGSIFVWASGNGGSDGDNCNCDGYTNSIYTLSVSSATEGGNVPWYSEACSSTLVSTYSSGNHEERQITTTDLRRRCTSLHTGTSASAPLAAGIVALTLQAKPGLSWRDVQYISVLAASPVGLHADDWTTNGAGRKVSHHFGFGMMNAGNMVDLALNWTNIPEQHICEVASVDRNMLIMAKERKTLNLTTAGCRGTEKEVLYVEHVQAKITLSSSWRGDLQMWLTSPSGTKSTLLTARVHDDSRMGFNEWGFLTTHMWGEQSRGKWTLEIANGYRAGKRAKLNSWSLVLYGTSTDPLNTRPPTTTTSTTTTTAAPSPTQPLSVPKEEVVVSTSASTRPPRILSTSKTTTENNIINEIGTPFQSPPELDTESHDGWIDELSTTISNSVLKNIDTGVKCPEKTFYLRDRCVDLCPDGYYIQRQSGDQKACKACHYTCAACEEAHNFSCTECYFGSRLHKGECVSRDDYSVRVGASSSDSKSLSQAGLKSIVYGGLSTVALLLLVLVSLLAYYRYHQYKIAHRHKHVATTSNNKSKSALTAYIPVNPTEILTGSKHSSQQELMDSEEEISSQGKGVGAASLSIEYIYNKHLPYGQSV